MFSLNPLDMQSFDEVKVAFLEPTSTLTTTVEYHEAILPIVANLVDEMIEKQRGFRSGSGCVGQVFVMKQMSEKFVDKNKVDVQFLHILVWKLQTQACKIVAGTKRKLCKKFQVDICKTKKKIDLRMCNCAPCS